VRFILDQIFLGETVDYRKLSEGWQTLASICPENNDGPALNFWFIMLKLSDLHVDKLLIKLLLSPMKQPSVHTLGACQ
jgi:hypothetical protein